MTFTIDTGEKPHRHWYWDSVLNHLPQDASEDEIYKAIAHEIARAFWKHKKPETVRGDLIKNWPALCYMATAAPDSFDWVLTEFAERATEFR